MNPHQRLNFFVLLLRKSCALFILTLMLTACSHSKSNTLSNKVKIADGEIEGTLENSGIISFKGIPYAAPPVGDLRWREPQPVQPWSDTKKCIAFSASPMQLDPEPFYMWSSEFLIPKEPISEDCLYLNVWTDPRSQLRKKPVLVWIYGGGFTSGGSAVPIYDGVEMAKQGLVFVSLNYRVGIFGFFSLPELSAESPTKTSGNYGLMDQIAALKWVKKNIASFGGDPDNVTIAGQSAGSIAVASLVASPMAKGLFSKAIAQSGAGLLKMSATSSEPTFKNLQQAELDGRSAVGDSVTLDQLRKLPAKQIMSIRYRGQPIVDGHVLPESLTTIFKSGKENQVALMTGWNQDEGVLFSAPKTVAEFRQYVKQGYGENEKLILDCYPAGSDEEAKKSELSLMRDAIFGAQNFTLANFVSTNGRPVFVYHFTKKVPGNGEYAKFGAFHTGEVPYALNTFKFSDRPWERKDRELAKVMSAYWANFAKSGNPNGDSLANWPRYDTRTKLVMDLGEQLRVKSVPDSTCLTLMSRLLLAE
jgi:para-nitrobenzyl esterase